MLLQHPPFAVQAPESLLELPQAIFSAGFPPLHEGVVSGYGIKSYHENDEGRHSPSFLHGSPGGKDKGKGKGEGYDFRCTIPAEQLSSHKSRCTAPPVPCRSLVRIDSSSSVYRHKSVRWAKGASLLLLKPPVPDSTHITWTQYWITLTQLA